MVKGSSKNLGMGLSALLGGENKKYNDGVRIPSENETSGSIQMFEKMIPIENIYPGSYQPRRLFASMEIEELASSIKEYGILQPILLRKHADKLNCYEIIAGERRWRAAQVAKIHSVPSIIRDFSDLEALEIGLVENLQRESLTPLEEAEGYRRLIEEFKHTQKQIAVATGKSRPHIANIMRLLALPEKIKEFLNLGKISAGHARALLNAKDPQSIANKIVRDGLSVREVEKICQESEVKTEKKNLAKSLAKDLNTVSLENDLSVLLGLHVEIDQKRKGGKLIVSYETLEQLDNTLFLISEGKLGRESLLENDESPIRGGFTELAKNEIDNLK
jgi:ParB family chromosome partitioning protein